MFLELLVVLIKENYVFFLGYNYFELSFLVIYFVSLLECYLKDYIDEFKFVFIFCSRLLFLLNRDEDDEFSQFLVGVYRLIDFRRESSIFFLVYSRESCVFFKSIIYVDNFMN